MGSAMMGGFLDSILQYFCAVILGWNGNQGDLWERRNKNISRIRAGNWKGEMGRNRQRGFYSIMLMKRLETTLLSCISLRIFFAFSSATMLFPPIAFFLWFYLFSNKRKEASQILSGDCQLYSLGMALPTKAVVIIKFFISQIQKCKWTSKWTRGNFGCQKRNYIHLSILNNIFLRYHSNIMIIKQVRFY